MQRSTENILKRIDRILSVRMPEENFSAKVNLSVAKGGVNMNMDGYFSEMIYGRGFATGNISDLTVTVNLNNSTQTWTMQLGSSLFIANIPSLKFDLHLDKAWTVCNYELNNFYDSHPIRSITFYVNGNDEVKFNFTSKV